MTAKEGLMMDTYAYAARVEKGKDGGFRVVVPTLGCTAEGDTYAAALTAARDAIEMCLVSLRFHGAPIPAEDHAETPAVVIAAEPLFLPEGWSGTNCSISQSRGVSFGTGYTSGIGTSVNKGGEA